MRIARMAGHAALLAAAGSLVAACGHHGSTVAARASHVPVSVRVQTPTGEIVVAGAIGRKYEDLGGRHGELGLPKGAEQDAPYSGRFQEFDGGAVYWSGPTGAHVLWGEIRNAWTARGGPSGGYGYPTGDEHDVPGGKAATFVGGAITWVDGRTAEIPTR